MSTGMKPSSVTQTWQVGPNYLLPGRGALEDVHEHEITKLVDAGALNLRLVSQIHTFAQHLALGEGLHSFLVDEGKPGYFVSGEAPNRIFEINVSAAGSFLLTTRTAEVRVNGRRCVWVRLRQGDKVETCEHTLEYVRSFEDEADKTFVSPKAGEIKRVDSNVTDSNKSTGFLLGIVFLCMIPLVGLSYFWFSSEKAGSQSTELITNQDLPFSELGASPVVSQAVSKTLDGRQYEELLKRYRKSGEKASVCKTLSEFLARQSVDNIWYEKARLFMKRRCE